MGGAPRTWQRARAKPQERAPSRRRSCPSRGRRWDLAGIENVTKGKNVRKEIEQVVATRKKDTWVTTTRGVPRKDHWRCVRRFGFRRRAHLCPPPRACGTESYTPSSPSPRFVVLFKCTAPASANPESRQITQRCHVFFVKRSLCAPRTHGVQGAPPCATARFGAGSRRGGAPVGDALWHGALIPWEQAGRGVVSHGKHQLLMKIPAAHYEEGANRRFPLKVNLLSKSDYRSSRRSHVTHHGGPHADA